MRVLSLATRELTWPLSGTGAARGRLSRTAILLELRTATGAVGLGEAAPLAADVPAASLAEGIDDLDAVRRSFAALAARIPFEVAGELDPIADLVADLPSPAARFAAETALASAAASERGLHLSTFLAGEHALAELPLAAVVDAPGQARDAFARGIRRFKIKVGPDDAVARATAIARAVPAARLRLDANQTWPRDRVPALLSALASLPIDYVEEPCADTLALLSESWPVKLALDESLASLAPPLLELALRSPGLAAVISKPAVLGGLRATLQLAARARAAGVLAVMSHALEGPIGTAACAELALALGGDTPAGLAPHAALAAWSLAVPQLAGSLVRPTGAPPLGFGSLDLATACAALSTDAPSAPHSIATSAVLVAASSDRSIRHAAASSSSNDLSIHQAAAEDPDAVALETRSTTLTFAAQSAAASRSPPARVLIAAPTVDTVTAIHAALAARRPLALVHHALPAAEQARQRALVEAAPLPPDAAIILFTSGSTGPARGVVLSHHAVLAAAAASAAHIPWRPDDRWLCALSLAHAGGLAVVIRCLHARKPVVLHDADFDRDAVAQLLSRCTLASLVPTQLSALLDDPSWSSPPSLRAVLLGGAPSTPALLDRARARGVPFLTTYGMTETLGQVATADPTRAGDPLAPLLPLPGVTFLAGTPSSPAPLRIRAPMLATCYLDGPAIAPELATADLAYLDGPSPHILGRADDVIITGGHKVHPSVIEATLASTPGVLAACAFGVPDPRWGEIVGAALAISATFSLPSALASWSASLPTHARPRTLALVASLPLLATGKVDRRAAAALPSEPVRYALRDTRSSQ